MIPSLLDPSVLITVGYNVKNLQSVEIYNPVTSSICSLPQLPEDRGAHTQDGNLACGGWGPADRLNNCVKWSSESGTWTQSHTLLQSRTGHVSWATEDGVYLMGGEIGKKTTELLKEDGSVEDGFSLKYNTR